MWRLWNCIPRLLRQQFHGPRASAGIYVEEEKAELDVARCVESINGTHGSHDLDQPLLRSSQLSCERGPDEHDQNGGTHQEHHDQWKHHCHGDFWSRFCLQHPTLEVVKWGAAVVLGLQLSRHPNIPSFLELLKDQDRRRLWRSLLFRMAFAMPPDARSSVRKCIIQEDSARSVFSKAPVKDKASVSLSQSAAVPEDKKTLVDVMQDFECSCRHYAAVGSSVSGILAAEQGQLADAVQQLQIACQLGHAPACYNLALCYQMGQGVEKDQKQAASYYRVAAEAGHAQSIYNLALMTLRGEGVAKDRAKAIKMLNQAAQQGLAQAQTYLGVYYTEDEDNQRDFQQAVSFFNAAAKQNDAEAQFFLGICYENGWGVESSDEEAVRLYAAAAEREHDGALYNLAAFHEYGLGGMKQDNEEALSLYKRSAQLGNDSAKMRLDQIEVKQSEKDADKSEVKVISDLLQSPSLRPGTYSSSPTLTDYLRGSIASIWMGGLTALSYAQTVGSEDQFIGHNYLADDCQSAVDVCSTSAQMKISHSCLPGLHRTSTMPELRMVPCQ